MQTHFESEIQVLKDQLLAMGAHAETAVVKAIRALVERSDQLARQVEQGDSELDQFELEIDDLAIHLLAKAPLASDLRLITVAMKVSQNLERVGDEATTIARRVSDLNTESELGSLFDLPSMADLALQMLKASLDSFVHRQPERARLIIPQDKQVDEMNRRIHQELSGCMVKNPAVITQCLNLMVISKALERIADHAKNIGEEVVYLYEARDIRHGGALPPE